jgi:hypothetical protein
VAPRNNSAAKKTITKALVMFRIISPFLTFELCLSRPLRGFDSPHALSVHLQGTGPKSLKQCKLFI